MKLFPGLAVHDSFDLRARHTVLNRERQQCGRLSRYADGLDVSLGQLRLAVSRSGLHCAVAALVVAVLLSGSPSQVARAVVQGVAVQVSALMAIWAWSVEGVEHKPVNAGHEWATVHANPYLFILGAANLNDRGFATFPRGANPGIRAVARVDRSVLSGGVPTKTRTVLHTAVKGWEHVCNGITGNRS
jgi:hypothetical protein